MKKRVFVIHSWGGSPLGGCLPWLKRELEQKGFDVFSPQMPNTEEPEINVWVSTLASLIGEADENTYFVGHSIGCQTILRYVESQNNKIGGALFVAGWFTLENLDEEEQFIAKPWIENPHDFEKLRSASYNYTLIISDDDPFGGYEKNIQKFESFGTKVVTLHNAGHIEQTELPIALDEFLKLTHE